MTPIERRQLSRDLSALANASVHAAIDEPQGLVELCPVVGVSGPPGAGKSTLIARLAQLRVEAGPVAIVAIDPTSPVSGGAILGDRIRMAELSEDPRIYIRSLATRSSHDGLADNLPLIVERLARAAFVEIVLETTGVGQVEYAIRAIADTMVLVLTPGQGDQIQAMKGGILETPDIFVINKADQAGAEQTAREISAMVRLQNNYGWVPPVIQASISDNAGLTALSAAIDAHRVTLADFRGRTRAWRTHVVRSLVARRTDAILRRLPDGDLAKSLPALFSKVARAIAAEDGETGS